mgnify:CR=1 FL=1
MPRQPRYEDFVPRFMQALFGPGDRVVLARLPPGGKWRDEPFARDDAIQALLELKDEANIYFRASAFDDSGGVEKGNCIRVGAIFLDLDYGKAGHAKASPFKTLEDCVGYLLTMPIRASAAWHTGHGVQACYLLDEPYAFLLGGGDALSMARYEDVSRRLSKMAMSDATFTPEHAFRVPLSLNDKREMDSNLPVVRGKVLWMDEARRYGFEEIETAVAGYGIEEHLAEEQKKADAAGAEAEEDDGQEDGGKDVAFADLPEDIRQQILHGHGERSDSSFGLIGRMHREGYSDRTIRDAIMRSRHFLSKNGAAWLKNDIERSLQKIRGGLYRYVYDADVAPPIETHNESEEIRLEDCAALPQALSDMLARYGQACGIKLGQRVLDAARFHEHMYNSQASGVLESPCGSGKSTWAICHIALNAREDNRYLYVAETVDALYKTADVLEKLADTPVGRSHGFNPEKCRALCGVEHTWRDCLPKDPKSACRTCAQNNVCAFYNRADEQKKPIVCMTHEGLIRAMEEDSELLKGTNILVDEELKPFTTWDVSLDDLLQLQRCVRDLPLDGFLPHGSFGCASELAGLGVPEGSDVFTSRNYVYRSEQETAALRPVCAELRKALAMPMGGNPFPDGAKTDYERAKSTLASLLNFFRPSKQEDAYFAFHEKHGKDGIAYTLKRSRYSLDVPRGYRKLWMLNASAQLSPYPYPDNLPMYACPDLPDNSHLVKLHAVSGHPMKTKLEENVWLSDVALWLGPRLHPGGHRKVLVATNKGSGLLDDIKAKIEKALPGSTIVNLTRGRIKGTNEAGECTLALIAGMSVFTTIDDCALHAALLLRRTFPDQPDVYSKQGMPNMRGGRFVIPAMNQYYALRALDEIYQTIWRTAVRNDLPVEAIIAVPGPEWLVALRRTVMPRFDLGEAFMLGDEDEDDKGKPGSRVSVKALTKEDKIKLAQTPEEAAYQAAHGVDDMIFERDPVIDGLRVICSPPGQEFDKQQIAEMFGYVGKDAWKGNRKRIMRLLEPFFEEGSTNRVLRRKDR